LESTALQYSREGDLDGRQQGKTMNLPPKEDDEGLLKPIGVEVLLKPIEVVL
jgi:hypothetical protein